MKNEEDKRNWLRNIRLLYIISLSIIGFLFVFIFQSSIENISLWLYDNIRSKSSIIYLLFLAFVLIGIYKILEQMGAIYFKWPDKKDTNKESLKSRLIYYSKEIFYNSSFKSCKQWPPIVLSILLSFLWLAIFTDYTLLQALFICICFILCLSIGLFLSLLNKNTTKKDIKPVQENKQAESFEEISQSPEKIIEWIQREEPIDEITDDIFDMKVISRRICRALLEPKLKSIALVGEYGSGKSSILNMVEYYLKPENREELADYIVNGKGNSIDINKDIVTCKVNGWGFTKGTAAEHILECAVNELGKHVDVCSLRFMPEQYTAAMGSSGNVLIQTLSSLATCCKSPLEMLKRMDNLLKAIDKNIVIFLEDVDRNKNEDTFFNEIAALLDNLRKLDRITFVLAIGQKYDTEEILIKTAEYVESVPRLYRLHVLTALRIINDNCKHSIPVLNNKIPEQQDIYRMGWNRNFVIEYAAEVDESMYDPIDAIGELISNPRTLKHALRRTLMLWDKLCGEINFDDLIIVSVLKTVDERLFSFIDKNISVLKYLLNGGSDKTIDELKMRLNKEYNSLIEGRKYEEKAVKELLETLFPKLFVDKNTVNMIKEGTLTTQCISSNGPTKYWERIKRGELYYNEITDCEILEAIDKWNKNIKEKALNKMEMIEALQDSEKIFPKIHQFKKLVSRDCLQMVASNQFQKTLNKYGNKAIANICPAVGKWHDLRCDHFDEQWQEWLFKEMKKAVQISLRYANDIYLCWYKQKNQPNSEIEIRIFEAIKKSFEDNHTLLPKVLAPDKITDIFNFRGDFKEAYHNSNMIDYKQWQWLGQLLLEAGKVNAKVVGPHIAGFVCYNTKDMSKDFDNFNPTLDYQIAKDVFNDNMKDVMNLLLLESVDIEKYDKPSQAILYFAREEAKKWFRQNDNQSNNDNSQIDK